jgi:hypothetical protein
VENTAFDELVRKSQDVLPYLRTEGREHLNLRKHNRHMPADSTTLLLFY